MRKAWLLLLVVALTAVSVSAFADGAWTAWNQGNFFPYIALNGNTGYPGWGPQWDTAPSMGIDQEWTFAYAGKNYGFNATFEFGGDQFVTGPTAKGQPISWFGTWYKFADMIKVTLGKPRIGDYNQFSAIEGNNYPRFGDSNWGAFVQVMPMDALSVGAVMYVPYQNAFAGVPGASGNGAGIGAQYAIPDVVTLNAIFKAIDFSKQVEVGAAVTAIKGFALNGAVDVDFSDSSNSVIKAFVSGSTAMDPLKFAADVAIKSQKPDPAFTFAAEVDAQYIMGMWALGATIGYDNGVGWFDQGVGDFAGLEFWPYVKANFDNGSYLKIGFLYAGGAGDSSKMTTGAKSVMGIPIYYSWAF
jgi:hypothetical protein